MQTDVYTRVILTVIAACLMWLCVDGPAIVPATHAQAVSRVVIAGWIDSVGNAHGLSARGSPIGDPLPVR